MTRQETKEKSFCDLYSLLLFYAEAGVDHPIVEDSTNHYRRPLLQEIDPPSIIEEKGEPKEQAPSQFLPNTENKRAFEARQQAARAKNLNELRSIMSEFTGCNLRVTAKNLVFSDGIAGSSLMLVGEAPGREEDLAGIPFVGRSGQLLDRILHAIGLDRQHSYIANIIPWRPPGNRPPTPLETEICRPFIERQIELAKPKVLITLGGPSTKTLLNTTEGILRLRGAWKTHITQGGVKIPTMPTLHPAYLLRNPSHKKFVWKDFLEVKAFLNKKKNEE